MFTRKDLKQRAKEVLKKNYWTAFALTVLVYAIEMIVSFLVQGFLVNSANLSTLNTGYAPILSSAFQFVTSGLMAVISLLLTPLTVGLFYYLIKSSNGLTGEVKDILYGYKANFGNIVSANLKMLLILLSLALIPILLIIILSIFLPSSMVDLFGYYFSISYSKDIAIALSAIMIGILFFIFMLPVIIKTYDYYLINFILADEKDLTSREVLKRSKALMKGHRFFAFKLDLSFMGWAILAAVFTFGIGFIFLQPYIYQTQTEFYLELTGKKKNAFYDVEFKEVQEPEDNENNIEENF